MTERRRLLKNTAWMGAGFAARLAIQIGYFLIVARTLGSAEYGAFAGAMALIIVLSPFAAWGTGSLLVRNVSRDPASFHDSWGFGLTVSVISGLALTVASLLLARIFWGEALPLLLVLGVGIGELVGGRLIDLSGQAFQAHAQLSRTSALHVSNAIVRLGLAVVFLLLPLPKTATTWGILYGIGALLVAGTAVVVVSTVLGSPRARFRPRPGEIREGFLFAVGLSAQGAYNDIDKALLVRLDSPSATGSYAAAYRIMDAAFLPTRSLFWASYADFFKHGAGGLRMSVRFVRRILPWVVGVGILAGFGLAAGAPLLPLVLGDDFQPSVALLWLLTPIPLVRGLQYLASDSLTGAGLQLTRSVLQITAALLNLGLNLWWIPREGATAAAVISVVSDLFLAAALWLAVSWHLRREVAG